MPSKNPGDAKEMLIARRSFLSGGYYLPIAEHAAEMINRHGADHPIIADIGCGEGYYTWQLERLCGADCIGADISKEGARMCCMRSKSVMWIVANAGDLPLQSESIDVVTAVFSLFHQSEYLRVLKKGGIFVEISAGSHHLTELKQLIYDEVFEQHKQPAPAGDGFETVSVSEESFEISPGEEALHQLLDMTPHSRRIRAENRDNINNAGGMKITVDYIIRVLRKK